MMGLGTWEDPPLRRAPLTLSRGKFFSHRGYFDGPHASILPHVLKRRVRFCAILSFFPLIFSLITAFDVLLKFKVILNYKHLILDFSNHFYYPWVPSKKI